MDKRLGFELRTVPSLIIMGGRLKGREADFDRFLLFITHKLAANQDQQDTASFSFLSTWMLPLTCWAVNLFLIQQICNYNNYVPIINPLSENDFTNLAAGPSDRAV